MNRIDHIRILLPAQFARHSEQIIDSVRQGVSESRWRGEGQIEQLDLGVIATTQHSTANEISAEILRRIEQQLLSQGVLQAEPERSPAYEL